MMNDPRKAGPAEACPLTHSAYIAAARALATGAGQAHRVWVQVRRFAKGGTYVACGQVVEIDCRSAEWFKVDTAADGPLWAEGRSLRLCSGDGRCTCEAAAGREGASC